MSYEYNNGIYRIVFDSERDYLLCKLSYVSQDEHVKESMNFEEYAYRRRYSVNDFNILEVNFLAPSNTDVYATYNDFFSQPSPQTSTFTSSAAVWPVSQLTDMRVDSNDSNNAYTYYVNTEAERLRRMHLDNLLNPINPLEGMSPEEFMREYQAEPVAYTNDENQDDNGQSENDEEEIKEEKINDKPDDIGTIFGKIDID